MESPWVEAQRDILDGMSSTSLLRANDSLGPASLTLSNREPHTFVCQGIGIELTVLARGLVCSRSCGLKIPATFAEATTIGIGAFVVNPWLTPVAANRVEDLFLIAHCDGWMSGCGLLSCMPGTLGQPKCF